MDTVGDLCFSNFICAKYVRKTWAWYPILHCTSYSAVFPTTCLRITLIRHLFLLIFPAV